ncbi:hypothetical protein Hdeb2414_s0005g00159561 [Helianthus debilis subsp. tardiflorus]
MGIFSGGRGNLLEEIFAASAPTGVKSGKGPRRLDISQITPPASPPSRTIDLTPPRDDPGKKKKEDEVAAENVGEGGGDVAGGASAGDRGKGVDIEVESNETAPRQTIYTKHPQVMVVLLLVLFVAHSLRMFMLTPGIPIIQPAMICHMSLAGT